MSLLQNIQNILGQNSLGKSLSDLTSGKGLGNLSGLLGPATLGGLMGALLTSKTARGITGGALLAGGGAALWNKYKERIKEANAGAPGFGAAQSPPEERAARIVRALVFAAKSDGHIDDAEQKAIFEQLRKLNMDDDAQRLVQQAINEPLDPELVARGVKNEEEALEIFTLSCAVITVDHFMERSYLDALAKALGIPEDVKSDLIGQLSTAP